MLVCIFRQLLDDLLHVIDFSHEYQDGLAAVDVFERQFRELIGEILGVVLLLGCSADERGMWVAGRGSTGRGFRVGGEGVLRNAPTDADS